MTGLHEFPEHIPITEHAKHLPPPPVPSVRIWLFEDLWVLLVKLSLHDIVLYMHHAGFETGVSLSGRQTANYTVYSLY